MKTRKKIKIDNGTWKKEYSDGCILWRCTQCDKAIVAGSKYWEQEHMCKYNFCPYCGFQHVFSNASIFDFELEDDEVIINE